MPNRSTRALISLMQDIEVLVDSVQRSQRISSANDGVTEYGVETVFASTIPYRELYLAECRLRNVTRHYTDPKLIDVSNLTQHAQGTSTKDESEVHALGQTSPSTSLRSTNSISTALGRVKDLCVHLKDDLTDAHSTLRPHSDDEHDARIHRVEEVDMRLEHADTVLQTLVNLESLIKRVRAYVRSETGMRHRDLISSLNGKTRSGSAAGDIRRSVRVHDVGNGMTVLSRVSIRTLPPPINSRNH